MHNFADEKTVDLVTYRKNGRGVSTPVWCVAVDEALYAFSNGAAGKVKRLRNSSRAQLAPCTNAGKPTGEYVDARAFLVSDTAERERVLAAFPGKYGFVFTLLSIFGRLSGRRRNWAVIRIEVADQST